VVWRGILCGGGRFHVVRRGVMCGLDPRDTKLMKLMIRNSYHTLTR
jgi:hypothetical protein